MNKININDIRYGKHNPRITDDEISPNNVSVNDIIIDDDDNELRVISIYSHGDIIAEDIKTGELSTIRPKYISELIVAKMFN